MKTPNILKLSLFLISGLMMMGTNPTIGQEKSGFIEVDQGIKLHYRITGNGTDTLVVADVGWLYPYIKENGRNLTYIVYDVRDRGYSQAIDDPSLISMEHEIADLEKVRQFFKIDKMNVAGWSYLGGMVALFAAQYPDHVHSIIQIGAIPLRNGKYMEAMWQDRTQRQDVVLNKKVDSMKSLGLDKADPEAFCKAYWEATLVTIIADKTRIAEFAEKIPYTCPNEWPENSSLAILFNKLGNWNWREQIQSIKARSLIVHGVHDNIPMESSGEWSGLIANSRILSFQSSGHMPMAEEPAKFFSSVEQFVKGHWPEGVVSFNQ
jgi:pimeloyl-ACP methyl ester carboxylesterase